MLKSGGGILCHDLVVRQAHHEVYFGMGFSVDLILSLSKDEVVPYGTPSAANAQPGLPSSQTISMVEWTMP
jgi:hypothetical protein